MYMYLCFIMLFTFILFIGKLTIPTCRFRCSQEFIVPGFNEHLKELHGKARECYLVWKDIGRPRTGDVHDDMRVSRLRFK